MRFTSKRLGYIGGNIYICKINEVEMSDKTIITDISHFCFRYLSRSSQICVTLVSDMCQLRF